MPVVKKPGSYGGVCPITGKSGEHDHVSYTDVCDAHRRIQAAGAHRTPGAARPGTAKLRSLHWENDPTPPSGAVQAVYKIQDA